MFPWWNAIVLPRQLKETTYPSLQYPSRSWPWRVSLGIKLLVRENRKFSLTPAGEYFYRKSLGVLDEAEQIKKQVVRIATQEQTEIRAGYLCSSRTKELSEALALFETTYPDIQITLEKGNHEELFRRLQEEQLDFVINDQRRAFSDEFVNFEPNQCF